MRLPKITTDIQLRFDDLDPLGHVSNNSYPQFLELARVDWRKAIQADYVPAAVIANLNIDFLHEIRMEDRVEVRTACIKVGTKSLVLQQDIYSNGECAAKATATIVAFDTKTRKSCEYPKGWEPSAA